jgi:hypothetical protein
MVEQSDVIFVGKLVRSIGNDEFDRDILVEPKKLLKGAALPKSSKIRGYLSDRIIRDGEKQFKISATNSDPFDIWRPHPDVWNGGCSRQQFNQDTLVVLFFKNEDGQMVWVDPIFGRGSEDVPDFDALWVRAIKLYSDISLLPKLDQRPALMKEVKALRASAGGNSLAELLADDIDRQLEGCEPVSDFVVNSNICNKPQWVYNIANIPYARRDVPKPIELETDQPKEVARNFGALIAAAALMAAILILMVLIRRNRRKSI